MYAIRSYYVVFELDRDGVVTFVNKNAYESFKVDHSALSEGMKLWDVLSPENRELCRRNFEDMPGTRPGRSTPAPACDTRGGSRAQSRRRGGRRRITSYNVCYTKLLRGRRRRLLPRDCDRQQAQAAEHRDQVVGDIGGGVITSYSIHYTKLYERPR